MKKTNPQKHDFRRQRRPKIDAKTIKKSMQKSIPNKYPKIMKEWSKNDPKIN